MPCKAVAENVGWLEALLAAADLVVWSKLICFADEATLSRCEIETFRYRILHMSGRIATHAGQIHLRLDAAWRWADALALAFARLHAAFA